MKINYQNNIAFGRKSPELWDADCIQRKVKNNFPMMSSTYIDAFYKTSGQYKGKSQHLISICKRIDQLIEQMRDDTEKGKKVSDVYIKRMNAVKDLHVGNCQENAMITVAALIANGYENTKRAKLTCVTEFYDKDSNKLLAARDGSLDHTFAVTDMNKSNNRDIVVDSWLGFVGKRDEAISTFKQIKTDKEYQRAVKQAYWGKRLPLSYEQILDRYNIKTYTVIDEYDEIDSKEIPFIKRYICKYYPQLLLKK